MNVTRLEGVITLKCNGTGFPIPDITWYQNGTALQSGTEDNVAITTNSVPDTRIVNSNLVITRPVVGNSGLYHCNLSSSVSAYEQVMSEEVLVLVQG